MINELRGALFLSAAFTFFLVVIGMLVLGSVMRPSRWSERRRVAT